MELFREDTDGSKLKNTRIMGRRNYCIVDYQDDGALRFDMRIEISQGEGRFLNLARMDVVWSTDCRVHRHH